MGFTMAEIPKPYDYDNDPDGFTRSDFDYDLDLDIYLNFARGRFDDGDGGVSITMVVDGALISGTVISSKIWADGYTSKFPDPLGEVGEVIRDATTKRIDNYKALAERRDAADLPVPPRRFIHLREGTVSFGGQSVTFDFWRIDRKKVSAWSPASYGDGGA